MNYQKNTEPKEVTVSAETSQVLRFETKRAISDFLCSNLVKIETE